MRLIPTRGREKAGSPSVSRSERPGLFYGWWIVMAGCLAAALSAGFAIQSFSVFFPVLEEEFGWSRAAIAAGIALGRAESGLLSPLEGYMVDRWGPRKVMLMGMVLMGVGFLLFSRVDSLLLFYTSLFLVLALGHGLGVQAPISVAVAKWFRRKRGLAYGIFRSGPGLGGFLLPLVGLMVVAIGWRNTATTMALVTLGAGVPLSLVMRSSPEKYGYLPDGATPDTSASAGGAGSRTGGSKAMPEEPYYTVGQALRSSRFWLISAAVGARITITAAVTLHFVSMLVDRDVEFALASTLLGIVVAAGTPARFGLSWLGDYVDRRRLMIVCMALLGLAVFVMGRTADLTFFVPATLLFALMFGGLAASQDALRADYFGTHSFGTIVGFSRSLQTVGSVIGPVMAGIIHDQTGSYTIAFTIYTVLALAGVACLTALGRPQTGAAPA